MNVGAYVVPKIGFEAEALAARMSQAFACEDPSDVILAVSRVVKSQNVSALALRLGIMRTTVYKTFGGIVDPQLSRILNLFAALDLSLAVKPVASPKPKPPRPKLGRPPKTPPDKID
jgi:DNA-binding phage protein